tara:strand:+ start:3032 stop:3679 length:648 start_codon:yes stop_codon:yes gene_type:complete
MKDQFIALNYSNLEDLELRAFLSDILKIFNLPRIRLCTFYSDHIDIHIFKYTNEYIIGISTASLFALSKTTIKFAIAHELGHLFKNKNLIKKRKKLIFYEKFLTASCFVSLTFTYLFLVNSSYYEKDVWLLLGLSQVLFFLFFVRILHYRGLHEMEYSADLFASYILGLNDAERSLQELLNLYEKNNFYSLLSLFSTHPSFKNRIAHLHNNFEKY